jgi:lipid A ethanolaminephosphotransferase
MKNSILIFKNGINLPVLILLVSAFITVTGNLTFFQYVLDVYPFASNSLFVLSLGIWIFVFLSIMLLIGCFKILAKPILIIVLILSSAITYFSNTYGTIFDINMIANSVETNISESLDLLSIKLFLYLTILGLLPSYLVIKVKITKTSFYQGIKIKLQYLVSLIIMFILITLIFSKSYTSFAREHKELRLNINPSYPIYSIGKFLFSKIKIAETPFVKIGEDAYITDNNGKKRVVILIVGETARADKFSLNGYANETNPILKTKDVISFKMMSSCGTDTAYSLPCMFSSLTKDDYTHTKGKRMSNSLDLLRNAGVKVIWLDNNSSSKSVADRIEYVDYKTPQNNPICDLECRDEGMVENLGKILKENKDSKNLAIVLHVMGSHGPAYYKRYPAQFNKFNPVCETNLLNECSDKEINNAYDNTIVYADYVLSKSISFLESIDDKYQTAMLYVSDHGESLGEKGLYLHGMPYFMAPKEQTHVASVLYLDEDYKAQVNMPKLKNNAETKRVSHDGFFHSILGLFSVNTKLYDNDLDFIPYSGK